MLDYGCSHHFNNINSENFLGGTDTYNAPEFDIKYPYYN